MAVIVALAGEAKNIRIKGQDMDFIRSLHWRHYDKIRGRFVSEAFEPSDDGGISVVDKQCIGNSGGTICNHLWKYYSKFIHNSAIYWEFAEVDLPTSKDRSIEYVPSDTGDPCHANIYGISSGRAKKFFKNRQKLSGISEFQICEKSDCSPRNLTDRDINNFVAAGS